MLFDYIDKGGVIGYLLVILFTLGMITIIWKFFHLIFVRVTKDKYIYQTLQEVRDIEDVSLALNVARESMDEKITSIEIGMNFIRTIASISPLIGLLGTVIGILSSFESIAATGLDDPTKFASGISLALVTTVMGLVIAIPHYIAYNHFNRNIDKIDAKFSKELDIKIIGDKKNA